MFRYPDRQRSRSRSPICGFESPPPPLRSPAHNSGRPHPSPVPMVPEARQDLNPVAQRFHEVAGAQPGSYPSDDLFQPNHGYGHSSQLQHGLNGYTIPETYTRPAPHPAPSYAPVVAGYPNQQPYYGTPDQPIPHAPAPASYTAPGQSVLQRTSSSLHGLSPYATPPQTGPRSAQPCHLSQQSSTYGQPDHLVSGSRQHANQLPATRANRLPATPANRLPATPAGLPVLSLARGGRHGNSRPQVAGLPEWTQMSTAEKHAEILGNLNNTFAKHLRCKNGLPQLHETLGVEQSSATSTDASGGGLSGADDEWASSIQERYVVSKAPEIHPRNDPTIYSVAENASQHLAELRTAFDNVDGIIDRPKKDGGPNHDALLVETKFTPERKEAALRCLLVALMKRCLVGFTGHPDKENAKPMDMTLNCAQRLGEIVETLTISKATCRDIFYSDTDIDVLVHQPISLVRTKARNNRNNILKAKLYGANKDKAAEFDALTEQAACLSNPTAALPDPPAAPLHPVLGSLRPATAFIDTGAAILHPASDPFGPASAQLDPFAAPAVDPRSQAVQYVPSIHATPDLAQFSPGQISLGAPFHVPVASATPTIPYQGPPVSTYGTATLGNLTSDIPGDEQLLASELQYSMYQSGQFPPALSQATPALVPAAGSSAPTSQQKPAKGKKRKQDVASDILQPPPQPKKLRNGPGGLGATASVSPVPSNQRKIRKPANKRSGQKSKPSASSSAPSTGMPMNNSPISNQYAQGTQDATLDSVTHQHGNGYNHFNNAGSASMEAPNDASSQYETFEPHLPEHEEF